MKQEKAMVFLFNDNSEKVAHVWSEIGNPVFITLVYISIAITNYFFLLPKKDLHTCATYSELPSVLTRHDM